MGPGPAEAGNHGVILNMGSDAIRLCLAGDLVIGGEFIPFARQHRCSPLHPFKYVDPYFASADLVFVNLEGPICDEGPRRQDVTAIVSNDSTALAFLASGGRCIANLANNHIMDYGPAGLSRTLELLDKAGIPHVGAGRNPLDATRATVIECKEKRIAFLAFSSDEPHIRAVIANESDGGCASYLDGELLQKVEQAKEDNDFVCVSLHWGHEYYQYPSIYQVNLAHALVDAGGSIIIGHHPHVIQGIEQYRGSLILYSLGNFFFPPIRSTTGRVLISKPLSKEFLLVEVQLARGGIAYEIHGGRLSADYTLLPYDGKDLKAFTHRMGTLSKPLGEAHYLGFWGKYQQKRQNQLTMESLKEACQKALKTPFKELISTVRVSDITRNMGRFLKFMSGSRN